MTVPVTCILPTFNRSEYLGEAIESILAQTRPPERVLVIDDGSTDATASLVGAFGPRVDYMQKANGGKSSALNVGLRATNSPFIWIFDDDDVADKDALERMYSVLSADEGLGFVFGPYRIFSNESGRTLIDGPETLYFPVVEDKFLLVAQLRHSFVHQPGLLVRKSCYDHVGPFDETILRSQDYEMMLRLSRAFVGQALRKPLFSQRRHAGVRGTASLLIGKKDVQRVWKRFDQEIVSRAYAQYDLGEFLSKDHRSCKLSRQDEVSARLERASIMAGRGLWSAAMDDLAAVLALGSNDPGLSLRYLDREALKRFFDRYSDGMVELMPVLDRLARLLAQSRATRVGRRMGIYLGWGLPYRLAADLAKGRIKRAARVCRALAVTTSFRFPLLLAYKVKATFAARARAKLRAQLPP